jgi:membrane protein
MAYCAAFSLFPLCLVLIAALGVVTRFSPQVQDEQRQLLKLVAENVSPWLAEQLGQVLAGVQTNALVGGPLGLATLILAAIGIFAQLENIFDRIWGTGRSSSKGWLAAIREALFGRLVAFLMLLGVGALLIVILVADVVLAGVRTYVLQVPAGLMAWRASQIILTVVGIALLLGVIYKVLPRARVRWREALGGGLLAAVVWQIGQRLLVAFVIGEKYSAYGVVGSFIAVMLWVYYASAVVFLGAEFVRALSRQRMPNAGG